MSEERDAAVRKMKAKLDDDRWEAKAEGREEYVQRVEALGQKRDELEQKLTDALEAASGAWQEMMQGFEDAWVALKNGFEQARAELD